MTKFIFSTAIALAIVSSASAAPVTNKTIILQWTSVGDSTREGDGAKHRFATNVTQTIYASSAGRLFLRRNTANQGRGMGSNTAERGPDGEQSLGTGSNVAFRGNALVGTVGYASGAVQFTATFDSSFSSCTVQVVYGRSGGDIKKRGPDGSRYIIHNIEATQPTCQISDGNPF